MIDSKHRYIYVCMYVCMYVRKLLSYCERERMYAITICVHLYARARQSTFSPVKSACVRYMPKHHAWFRHSSYPEPPDFSTCMECEHVGARSQAKRRRRCLCMNLQPQTMEQSIDKDTRATKSTNKLCRAHSVSFHSQG
jgi:hypothetical protein